MVLVPKLVLVVVHVVPVLSTSTFVLSESTNSIPRTSVRSAPRMVHILSQANYRYRLYTGTS